MTAKKVIKLITLACTFVLTACSNSQTSSLKLPKDKVWINHATQNIYNKVVLLSFITNNCKGCRLLAPTIQKLSKKYHKQIKIIAVYTANKPSANTLAYAKKTVAKYRLNIPVLYDSKKTIKQRYNITGWPTTVLFNKQHQAVKYIYGPRSYSYLQQTIKQA